MLKKSIKILLSSALKKDETALFMKWFLNAGSEETDQAFEDFFKDNHYQEASLVQAHLEFFQVHLLKNQSLRINWKKLKRRIMT